MVQFIESELQLLRKEMDEMWTLVYNQLDRACESVLTFDKELAQQVLVREKRVNAFELKIDSDVEDVIALYTPAGIDLRFVLAIFKMNSNLERIGDFAKSIARFSLESEAGDWDADLLGALRLQEMATRVLTMLETAKEALDEENLEKATAVFGQDNLLDEIKSDAQNILADYLMQHPDRALTCLNLSHIVRKLERSGDHITNMAEEIVFYMDAKVVKHANSNVPLNEELS